MRSNIELSLLHKTDESLSKHRFVELGAKSLTQKDRQSLEAAIPALLEIAARRRVANPRRAGQIEFLLRSLDADPEQLPEIIRREVTFALLYFSRCSDLLPNPIPVVGFLDEEVALELVLSRYAWAFEEFCSFNLLDWRTVRPVGETAHSQSAQTYSPSSQFKPYSGSRSSRG